MEFGRSSGNLVRGRQNAVRSEHVAEPPQRGSGWAASGTFHAGAKAGSLWQLEQTVASSGSSSAQCGHTFTLGTFGAGSP